MWDDKMFNESVSRMIEALTPIASPGGGFSGVAVREASARGRHLIEELRLHVAPAMPGVVAQDLAGLLGRIEALLNQLGNPAATRLDQTQAALAARATLSNGVIDLIRQALRSFAAAVPRRAVLFTGDVRVAELQFLSAVEQAGDFRLTPGADGFRDVPADVVCQMAYSLLEEKALNGSASLATDADPAHAETRRNADLRSVLRGEVVDLRLNHTGRLRLARLRDELLAFDKKERFGILLDARGLDRVLAAELAITTAARPLAVLAGDVDHFKSINDQHGHPRGDDVLKAVFRIFSEEIDTHGKAFRQGGEEVIGIIPVETAARARVIAETVRRRVAAEVSLACELPRPVTISLGLLVLVDGTRTLRQVIEQVDQLLYRAKQGGRDRVVTDEAPAAPSEQPRPSR